MIDNLLAIFGLVFHALALPPLSVFLSVILLCFGLLYIKELLHF